MKEFMLLVFNVADHQDAWPADKHAAFLKKCETYIDKLKKNGNLKIAQPLIREGTIISGPLSNLKETPLDKNKIVQVGYYHVLAKDLNEANEIAKENPEFEFSSTASVEVRPIKTKEVTTGYVYK